MKRLIALLMLGAMASCTPEADLDPEPEPEPELGPDPAIAPTATCSWETEGTPSNRADQVPVRWVSHTTRGVRAIGVTGDVIDPVSDHLDTAGTLDLDGVVTHNGELLGYGDGAWHWTDDQWAPWLGVDEGERIVHASADPSSLAMLVYGLTSTSVWRLDKSGGAVLPPAPVGLPAYVVADGDAVWVLGDETYARWDGSTWAPGTLPSTPLRVVGAFDGTLVYADRSRLFIGSDSIVPMDMPPIWTGLRDVWGTGVDDIWFALDLAVFHWDGTAWSRHDVPTMNLSSGFSDAAGTWVVGRGAGHSFVHDVVSGETLYEHQKPTQGSAAMSALVETESGDLWGIKGPELHRWANGAWREPWNTRDASGLSTRGDRLIVVDDRVWEYVDYDDGYVDWEPLSSRGFDGAFFDPDDKLWAFSYSVIANLDTGDEYTEPWRVAGMGMLGDEVVYIMHGRADVYSATALRTDPDNETVVLTLEEDPDRLFNVEDGTLMALTESGDLAVIDREAGLTRHQPMSEDFLDLWGRSADDFFVVEGNAVRRYRDGTWTTELNAVHTAIYGRGDTVVVADTDTVWRGSCP